MKFICKQQVLSKALNTVSKAVTTKTTIPILKGILLKADDDGKLILTSQFFLAFVLDMILLLLNT